MALILHISRRLTRPTLNGIFNFTTASNNVQLRMSRMSEAVEKDIGFPYIKVAGKLPGVVFAHGLGFPWNFPLPLAVEHLAKQFGHCSIRFEYKIASKIDTHVWHPDDHLNDLLAVIDNLCTEQQGKYILVGFSAGAFTAVRAALLRKEKVHSLLLLSPTMGMDTEYLNRVMGSGAKIKLYQGEMMRHPEPIGGYSPLVSGDNIMDYSRVDPLNSTSHLGDINVVCPVKILHGMKDRFVPWQNCLKIVEKLASEDVELVLLKNQGHILETEPEVLRMLTKMLEELKQEEQE